MKTLWHTTNIYVQPALHEYCQKLTSHLPDPLKVLWFIFILITWINVLAEIKMCAGLCVPVQVVYLTNSGSEANDLAMLMARLHTGNFDIITFRYSLL